MIRSLCLLILFGLLLMNGVFAGQEGKKKYHLLYSGFSDGAYGPCG